MENLSLYNILVGQFTYENKNPDEIDFMQFENLSEEQKLSLSIIENLRMILTTRKGSVLHLPDFGMSDIMQLYREEGNPIDALKKELKEVILKYEPRVGEVKIEKSAFDPKTLRASLKVIIKIKDSSNKEILLTEFSTTGWTKVIQERDSP